ncbi:hypothetical protein [Synoicihabitans lomoniglobus]|uniref:DUF1570 domain-containing protein n=1 Tax=Synoicihabitans lomoniglobus TaxID=2909285 RepID=A0AAE9ZTX9_9BACT|nr:hypothetical protein [Opitutaceae bacterium LMO-M01]WED63236.1 hypothetical protein PXH66_12940 [Opitutaceae bacterium LMO-M01]
MSHPPTPGRGFGLPLIALVVSSLFLPVAQADWRTARSHNFELYSQVSDAKSRETLQMLETFRHAVIARLHLPAHRLRPTTVFLFARDEDYGPYKRLADEATVPRPGHGVVNPDRVVLALHANVDDDLFQALLFHHYAHALIDEAGFAPPPWLAEGMATALGGFQVQNGRYAFKRFHADSLPVQGVQVPEGYIHRTFVEEYRTMHGSFTRLRRLAKFDRVIRDGNRAAADLHAASDGNYFYLQSWLLAHYCLFGAERGQYGAPLLRYAMSAAGDDAQQHDRLERTLGMSDKKLRRTLERYYESGSWTDLGGPVPAIWAEFDPRFEPANVAAMAVELAGLALASRGDPVARAELRTAAETSAQERRASEILAVDAGQRGDESALRDYAARAIAGQTMRSYFFTALGELALQPYGSALDRAGRMEAVKAEATRGLFERAIALDPGDERAWAGLAWTEALAIDIENANVNRVQDALGAMRRPEETLLAVAVIRWRIGDTAIARSLLTKLPRDADWVGAERLVQLREVVGADP